MHIQILVHQHVHRQNHFILIYLKTWLLVLTQLNHKYMYIQCRHHQCLIVSLV